MASLWAKEHAKKSYIGIKPELKRRTAGERNVWARWALNVVWLVVVYKQVGAAWAEAADDEWRAKRRQAWRILMELR